MEQFESRRSRYVVSLVLRDLGSYRKFRKFHYGSVSFSLTSFQSPIVALRLSNKARFLRQELSNFHRFKCRVLKMAHLSPQHVNNMASQI